MAHISGGWIRGIPARYYWLLDHESFLPEKAVYQGAVLILTVISISKQ